MKGAPIKGPRFSGVDDDISGFTDSGLGNSSSKKKETPESRR